MNIAYWKMNGLGNDFVVIDARQAPVSLSQSQIRQISDRQRGIGCDQLIILRPSDQADIFMAIYNADGSEVGACGNATRCVAKLLDKDCVIQTKAGLLKCQISADLITVDMGPPRLNWQDIPLAEPGPIVGSGPLKNPVFVSMGNPHAVFFVDNADTIDLKSLGSELEHHQAFPERANINVVEVLNKNEIRHRVWERGAGITKACGTGACASVVAAILRELTARKVTAHLDGGDLIIDWPENGSVLMTGPATLEYKGTLSL